jgi:hypothetical protein
MSRQAENYRVSEAEIDYAADLLDRGASPDEVLDRLVARGTPPEAAAGVLDELAARAASDTAVELLGKGYRPAEVKQMLAGGGLDPRAAAQVVDDAAARSDRGEWHPLIRLAGLGIFGLGVVLLVGNVTGAFPSVPFAGWVVMTIGGADEVR